MSSTTRFTCTRVINKPVRFNPDSKEYHYKNDSYAREYDPEGKIPSGERNKHQLLMVVKMQYTMRMKVISNLLLVIVNHGI